MRLGIDGRLVGRGLGIAHFVEELVAHLDDSVQVVWFGDPAKIPERAEAVRRIDHLPYPTLDGAFGRRLVQASGVDVMHFTGNTGWTRPGKTPFVLTVHDLIFLTSTVRARSLRQVVGHRYMRRNVPAAVRIATAVACPSQVTADIVGERLRPSSRPRAIPHGMERPARAPAHHGAVPGSSYALAFSARDPRKGVELALRGWLAAARKPEQLVILAGAGLPAGFDRLVDPFVSRGVVRLLPYLPREQLWAVLEGASVLLHPSAAEGFGLPVLEAMTAGVPVISGLTPTSAEIGPGAFLTIDPADPVGSIASGLTRLATEPTLRDRLVELGRAHAERFNWERTADEYRALYAEALQAGPAASSHRAP